MKEIQRQDAKAPLSRRDGGAERCVITRHGEKEQRLGHRSDGFW